MLYLPEAEKQSMITLQQVRKQYGTTLALDDISLTIACGEFFVLVGQSGSGKTTLLKMLNRLIEPDSGTILVGGENIRTQSLRALRLNTGYVLQHIALFPNMTVAENIGLIPEMKGWSREKRLAATRTLLQQVDLPPEIYLPRYPQELSGGEQQRIGILRAIIAQPQLLLMDEPLSNLDAKLRVEMRTAIKEIQNSIGITTVYVTHDQEEAMAVSDRIAVMKDGAIQHLGQPKDIYQRPANLFVATFIGKTNVLKGTLDGSTLKIAGKYDINLTNIKDKNVKGNVTISIRPEEFVIDESQAKDGMKAFIDSSVFLGLNTHYFAHLENGEKLEIVQESKIDNIIPKGTEVYLKVKQDKINVFTEDGSKNILEGVNNDIGVAYAK